MEEEVKLKPCPFCGGEAAVSFSGSFERGGYIHVRCTRCKASVGAGYYHGEPPKINLAETDLGRKAVSVWNNRVPEMQNGRHVIHGRLIDAEVLREVSLEMLLSEGTLKENVKSWLSAIDATPTVIPKNYIRLSGVGRMRKHRIKDCEKE